jgi:Asp-tRNA(Asn)/Glu-tRNA(Gln) amidotransferase A subunit family amidase
VAAIDESRILGIRAGARAGHRFIGIWAVVVDGRVFARSWPHKPGGWYRTLLDDPLGTIQVAEREVRIRAARVRGKRIRDAIERAFETVDVLVTPTVPVLPTPIAATSSDDGPRIRNVAPFSLAGFPAISVPCGFSRSGLPIGLQLVAPS